MKGVGPLSQDEGTRILDAVAAVGSLLLALLLLPTGGLPISHLVTLEGMRVTGWHPAPSMVFGGAVLTPLFLFVRRRSLRRTAWFVRAGLWAATLVFAGKAFVLLVLGALSFMGVTRPAGPVDHVAGAWTYRTTAPETWWVDGSPVEVHTTYYERVGDELLFRIEVPREGAAELTDQELWGAAWPIHRHAWRSGKIERGPLPFTEPPRAVQRVIVTLFEKVGFAVRGRRNFVPLPRFPELISQEDDAIREAQPVAYELFNMISRGNFDAAYDRASPLLRKEASKEDFREAFEPIAEAMGPRLAVHRPPITTVHPSGWIRFVYPAEYEQGPAFARVDVHRDEGEWRLLSLKIESPVFRDRPAAPDADPPPGTRVEPERFTGLWTFDSIDLSIDLLVRDDGTFRWTTRGIFQKSERRGRWVSGERRLLLYHGGYQESLLFTRGTLLDETTLRTLVRAD